MPRRLWISQLHSAWFVTFVAATGCFSPTTPVVTSETEGPESLTGSTTFVATGTGTTSGTDSTSGSTMATGEGTSTTGGTGDTLSTTTFGPGTTSSSEDDSTGSTEGPEDESTGETSGGSETTTGGGGTTYCEDADDDGFGNPNMCDVFEAPPSGWVQDDSDCDDGDDAAFPGAAPHDSAQGCLADADGDDWGDASPGSGVVVGTDCDDDFPFIFPGAARHDDPDACMRDEDGDDWGDVDPGSRVTPGSDCDDVDEFAFPGAAPQEDPAACMRDEDGDDFGSTTPGPTVTVGTDCNDRDEYAFPGAAPNDDPTACYRDADGDGWGDRGNGGTDCDDGNPDVQPGIAEHESCLCTIDLDEDGWGEPDPASATADAGHDCDDGDPSSNTDCGPVCNDDDADGFSSTLGCVDHIAGDPIPAGKALLSCDCTDADAAAFPGAAPNDSATACMRDEDGDDWGEIWPPTAVIAAGTDCVDDDAFAWPYVAFQTLPVDRALLPSRISPRRAANEPSSACQLDYDLDGYASTYVPPPDPAYPFAATNWIEAGTDADDFTANP